MKVCQSAIIVYYLQLRMICINLFSDIHHIDCNSGKVPCDDVSFFVDQVHENIGIIL